MNTKIYSGMFEIKQHLLLLTHFHSKYRFTRTNFPYNAGTGKKQHFNEYSTHSIPKLDEHQVDLG